MSGNPAHPKKGTQIMLTLNQTTFHGISVGELEVIDIHLFPCQDDFDVDLNPAALGLHPDISILIPVQLQ